MVLIFRYIYRSWQLPAGNVSEILSKASFISFAPTCMFYANIVWNDAYQWKKIPIMYMYEQWYISRCTIFSWHFLCNWNKDTLWTTVIWHQDGHISAAGKMLFDSQRIWKRWFSHRDNSHLAPTTIPRTPSSLGQKSQSIWRTLWDGDGLNTSDLRECRDLYLALAIIVFLHFWWYVLWTAHDHGTKRSPIDNFNLFYGRRRFREMRV